MLDSHALSPGESSGRAAERDPTAAGGYSALPLSVFQTLTRHYFLVWQLTRRAVAARYRGSLLGVLWSFVNPLLMLGVYTFVFGVVFEARWGRLEESRLSFALTLFTGLIVHSLFSECLNRAPTLIVSNTNYVKRVVFPLETLAWTVALSALFHAGISLLVLVAVGLLSGVLGSVHLVWTPLVLAPLVVLSVGVVWFVSAVGVFFRDIGHIANMLSMALLFLTPIFYPETALPERFRELVRLNPLTVIVQETRRVVLWGEPPSFVALGAYTLAAVLTAWLGLLWFQKSRKGFADVL